MHIEKLILSAFGQYDNKEIELHKGLNIIYGENESGKSTIHKFIEAMYFGFFKDQKNRRAYSDDYEKYLPLHLSSYGGTMIIDYQNRKLRVERNLLKGKDKVSIYENETGQDITEEFHYDNATKLYCPLKPSEMNRRMYSNTVSIAQLSCGTERDLVEELKDRLANFGESKSDLSVKKALQSLTDKLNDIGTEKRKNTPLHTAHTNLEALKKKRQKVLEDRQKVTELIEQVESQTLLIAEKKRLKEQYEKNIQSSHAHEWVQTLDEYDKVLREKKDIVEQLSQIDYKEVSQMDYESIKKYTNLRDILKGQIEGVKEKIVESDSQIKELEGQVNNEPENTEIQNDYNEIQRLNSNVDMLYYKNENSNCFLVEDKVKAIEKDIKGKLGQIIALAILSLIGIILGITVNPLFYVSLILLAVGILSYRQLGEKKVEEKEARERLLSVKKAIEDTELKLRDCMEKIEGIVAKYHCKNYEEFVQDYYENYKARTNKRQKDSGRLIGLREKKKSFIEEVRRAKEEIDSSNEKILFLLQKNEVNTLEEMQNNMANMERAKELKAKLENKMLLLDKIINPQKLEEAKKRASDFLLLKDYFLADEALDGLVATRDALEEDIKKAEMEKSKVDGYIQSIGFENENLTDLDSEIDYVENEIAQLKSKESSLQLAINTIQHISGEIHREFAPELNKLLGQILKEITGKPREVKVTKDLDIKVEDVYYKQLLDLNKLSSGTVDQLYFAFRMGLNDFISKTDFPILLDESFVQYDDKRLSNVLKYLVSLSHKRQIIIFTSQRREKTIIEKYTDKFKEIVL